MFDNQLIVFINIFFLRKLLKKYADCPIFVI